MPEDARRASACGVFLQPLPDNSSHETVNQFSLNLLPERSRPRRARKTRSQANHGLRGLLLARAEMTRIPGVKRVETATLKIGGRLLRRRGYVLLQRLRSALPSIKRLDSLLEAFPLKIPLYLFVDQVGCSLLTFINGMKIPKRCSPCHLYHCLEVDAIRSSSPTSKGRHICIDNDTHSQ